MAGGSVDKRAAARQEAIEWVQRLCGAVRQAVEADRVIAWVYDAPRQAVTPLAVDSATPAEEVPPEWRSIPLADMPAAVAVLLQSRPVEIEDAQDDDRIPAELAADLGMSSIRIEPLIAGGTVGMVSIEPVPRDAGPELHSLLTTVAAAVARAGSMVESDRHQSETSFLLELTEVATKAPSLDEMLIVVCERMARALGARRATVLLHEAGRLVPSASRHADGSRDIAEWEAMRQAPLPAAQVALDSGEPVVVNGMDDPLIGTWGAIGFATNSLLAVPLGTPPNVIGVVVLDDPAPDRFSNEDVRLAVSAAAHVAPTIEQARTSDERTWHLRAATAIRGLLEEGARAKSVVEAGEVLARVTREAIEAENATLLLRDEEDRVEHVTTVGANGRFEDAFRDLAGSVPARDFRAWRIAARQPKPIFVENARASRLLPPDLVDALSLKSYVVVPLVSATRPLGLVILGHTQAPRPWSNEERRLVDQLALEGSLVVENAALRATERERLEELAHQAFHDSLTELPNRALFADRLEHALERTNRRKAAVAVLFLDLDDFKPINDNFGHEAGDQLLTAVAQRIKACVRPEDTVARLGGDEFTVLLEDIADVRYAIAVAERIEESLRDPFRVDGHEASVTASLGIAVSTGREASPEDLMRHSDQAMYIAKQKGRARHEVFRGSTPSTDRDEPDGAYDPAAEGSAAGEALAVQEMAAEISIEEALVVERAEGPSFQDEPEYSDAGDAHDEDPEADRFDEAEAVALGEPPDAGDDIGEPVTITEEEHEQPAPENPGPPDEDSDEGAAALTEARRRRRLRFPPRR
jgi:diguanylate cyclase (GGDEF)-like protein